MPNTLGERGRFILTGDLAGADAHFTRFSRLERLILENSRDTVASLQSELDLLENYVRIEQLRFGENLFDYRLELGEGVDPEAIMFPSMILQPFVENAILHGLRHRTEGGGQLRVAVEHDFDSEEIRIIIEDNDIGRRATAAIEQAEKTHRSVGLDIARRHLEMFGAARRGRKAGVEIFDLTDENGRATGTRVEIWT